MSPWGKVKDAVPIRFDLGTAAEALSSLKGGAARSAQVVESTGFIVFVEVLLWPSLSSTIFRLLTGFVK